MSKVLRKHVYLIITDLHLSYRNKANRRDYLGEIKFVKRKIIELINDYKNKGYEVTIIFLGDIFDNSFKSVTHAIRENNFIVLLENMCHALYTVVGNHELSYYVENPFWDTISEINSERLKRIVTKTWQPRGLLELIKVQDELEDGEVVFKFNHHGTGVQPASPNKINIGLFHQDIYTSAIVQDAKNKGLDMYELPHEDFDKTHSFDGYSYVFLGHMHKLYGTWNFTNEVTNETTQINHLGSLGRPNHSEVKDTFLERNIPAIIVEDGKLVSVDANKFNLPSRDECVLQEVIDKQQEIADNRKEVKEVCENYLPKGDDPSKNILEYLGENKTLVHIFTSFLEEKPNILESELQKKLDKIKYL